MKSSSLVIVTLGLSLAAHAGDYEKSFTCKNANGSVVITEKKISVLRETSFKHFNLVIKDSLDASIMPDVNAILLYANDKSGIKQDFDVVMVKELTDRKKIYEYRDKGGMDTYILDESYKIKADIALSGLSTQSVELDCIENTNRE